MKPAIEQNPRYFSRLDDQETKHLFSSITGRPTELRSCLSISRIHDANNDASADTVQEQLVMAERLEYYLHNAWVIASASNATMQALQGVAATSCNSIYTVLYTKTQDDEHLLAGLVKRKYCVEPLCYLLASTHDVSDTLLVCERQATGITQANIGLTGLDAHLQQLLPRYKAQDLAQSAAQGSDECIII